MAETEQKKEPEKPQEQPVQPTQGDPAAYDFLHAKEAQATGETYLPSAEELKNRNQRSLAIAGGIVLFMVIVFAITVLKISNAASG